MERINKIKDKVTIMKNKSLGSTLTAEGKEDKDEKYIYLAETQRSQRRALKLFWVKTMTERFLFNLAFFACFARVDFELRLVMIQVSEIERTVFG